MEETHHKQILVNFVAIAVFGSPSRKDRISFTILISMYSLEHTMAYYQTAIFFFFFCSLATMCPHYMPIFNRGPWRRSLLSHSCQQRSKEVNLDLLHPRSSPWLPEWPFSSDTRKELPCILVPAVPKLQGLQLAEATEQQKLLHCN